MTIEGLNYISNLLESLNIPYEFMEWTSDIPETLIIHSKSDSIVPFKSSEELAQKCEEVNAHSKFIALNSSSHDLSEISPNDIINISKGLLFFVIANSPL